MTSEAVVETTETEAAEQPTREELQAQVTALEDQLAAAGRTMIEFKAKVRTEAMRMAEQHNLCTVVEQTLHKVGIDTVRRRVEVTYTYRRVNAYEVPDELITLITAEEFMLWATTGQVPRGRTSRDFRSVRALAVNETPFGEGEMVISDPRTTGTVGSPIGITPPVGWLAAYASDDSRVLHYLAIGNRTLQVNRLGRYDGFRGNLAACGGAGHWQDHSARASNPPRVCARCANAVPS